MEYLKGITYSVNMSGLYQERQTPSFFVVASMTLFAQSAPLFFLPLSSARPALSGTLTNSS